MLMVFIRTLILYGLVVVGMRIMGKRQLGELQPSELVITILISNIATLPIENTDVPLLSGAVPILTLMCFEVLLSFISMKSLKLRTLISGTPRIVIKEGIINQQELASLRYSVDDLMEQLRVNGIFDIQQVEMAVVETTGQLSVYEKSNSRQEIPTVVINGGQIVKEGLQYCGSDEATIRKLAEKRGYVVEDVFLMTCTPTMKTFLVPMEKRPEKKGGDAL